MKEEKDLLKPSDDGDEYFFIEDDYEFTPCSKCDGHPACEDFGCAYELGKGRMVNKYLQPGQDHWG